MTYLVKSAGVAFFAFFIGLLLGLSNSPVVGLIMGALAASIAIVIGIIKKDEIRIPPSEYLLIGVFGVFGSIGVLSGLHIRTGNIFNDDLVTKAAKWHNVVRDSSQVEAIVIFLETGLIIDPDLKLNERQNSVSSKVLFSVDSEVADKLNPENFNNVQNIQESWKSEGDPWALFAERIIKNYQVDAQREQFQNIWILLKE